MALHGNFRLNDYPIQSLIYKNQLNPTHKKQPETLIQNGTRSLSM